MVPSASPRRVAVIVLCLLGLAPGAAGAMDFFLPGNEEAVVALLRPHSDEDLTLGAWSLERLEVGPACEIRLGFEDAGSGDRTVVHVGPKGDGTGALAFRGVPRRPESLGAALEGLVLGNDPGHFFRDRCRVGVDPENGTDGDPPPSEFVEAETLTSAEVDPSPTESGGLAFLNEAASIWVQTMTALFWLLVLAAGGAALVLQRRRRSVEATISPPPRLVDEPGWVRWVFSGALLVRLISAWISPSFLVESTQFIGAGQAYDFISGRLPLFSAEALFGASISYHLPLIDLLVGPWLSLGDLMGVGGHIIWLRLPALVASAGMMILLLRTGQHLGAPRAGRIALVLFAFLPACVRVSVTTTHYLMEMTAAAWLLERAAAVTFGGRPQHRSLALAAAAACWSGFVAWALVAIVGLGVVISEVRRGRLREVSLVVLFVLAAMAPLMNTAWDTLGDTAERSQPLVEGVEASAAYFAVPPMIQPSKIDFLQLPEPLVFPWHMATHLFDGLSMLLAILGICVALWLRPRLAPVTLGLLIAYGLARMHLQLSHDNLSLLFPLFLLLPAVGAEALADRLRSHRWPRFLAPAWMALALIGGVVTADVGDHIRYWERGGWYYQHQARRLFLGENVHAIRGRLRDLAAAGDVLLLAPEEPFYLHAAVCDALPTVAAMKRCTAVDWELDAALTSQVTSEWIAGLNDSGAFDGRPVALLGGPDRGHIPGLVDAMGRDCEALVDTPMLTLLSCPVPQQPGAPR